MSALTSAGPWLADAAFVPYAATAIVYGRVTPRLVLGVISLAAALTTVPVTPPYTRYPLSP